MRLEIIDNEIRVELENVVIKDFRLDVESKKRELEDFILDFSSITQLKGEKILLEKAFQDTKKETLENYG